MHARSKREQRQSIDRRTEDEYKQGNQELDREMGTEEKS